MTQPNTPGAPAEIFATGFNSYPTLVVRYMLDLNIEHFKEPVLMPVGKAPGTFFTFLMRVQRF